MSTECQGKVRHLLEKVKQACADVLPAELHGYIVAREAELWRTLGPDLSPNYSKQGVKLAKKLLLALRAAVQELGEGYGRPVWIMEAFRTADWDLRRALVAERGWIRELAAKPIEEFKLPAASDLDDVMQELANELSMLPRRRLILPLSLLPQRLSRLLQTGLHGELGVAWASQDRQQRQAITALGRALAGEMGKVNQAHD